MNEPIEVKDIEEQLLQGLSSGDSILMDEKEWKKLHQELDQRLRKQEKRAKKVL